MKDMLSCELANNTRMSLYSVHTVYSSPDTVAKQVVDRTHLANQFWIPRSCFVLIKLANISMEQQAGGVVCI
jgi:hypothetical protein